MKAFVLFAVSLLATSLSFAEMPGFPHRMPANSQYSEISVKAAKNFIPEKIQASICLFSIGDKFTGMMLACGDMIKFATVAPDKTTTGEDAILIYTRNLEALAKQGFSLVSTTIGADKGMTFHFQKK